MNFKKGNMKHIYHDIGTNIDVCYIVNNVNGKKKLDVKNTFYHGTRIQPDMTEHGYYSARSWEEFLLEATEEESSI